MANRTHIQMHDRTAVALLDELEALEAQLPEEHRRTRTELAKEAIRRGLTAMLAEAKTGSAVEEVLAREQAEIVLRFRQEVQE